MEKMSNQDSCLFDFEPGVPGPPSKPVATHVTCRSCLLTWSAPLIDGGKPVIGYRIQLRTRKSCGWTEAIRLKVNETQYLMTKLKPGMLYQFRIAAVNELGSGTGGPESNYVEAADKPDPPSRPRELHTTRTCSSLSWNPPSFDGGAAVIGYRIEYRPKGSEPTIWAPMTDGLVLGTTFCVRRLHPSTGYHFRVVAINKIGESQPGNESELIETIEPPGEPSKPEIYDITFRSCKLSWDPPQKNGGTKITHYLVEGKAVSSNSWEVKCEVTAQEFCVSLTDLKENCDQYFRIKAKNKVGFGQPGPVPDIILLAGADLAVGLSLSGVKDDVLDAWGMSDVCDPFRRGLDNLTLLVNSVHPLRMCITYREIYSISSQVRKFSMKAFSCMRDAAEKASNLNKELNTRIENLVVKEEARKCEKTKKEKEIENNNEELSRLRSEQYRAQEEYERALEAQNEAEANLNKAKRERDIVRYVGAGLFAVPIIGWIAGATMVAVSYTSFEDAVKAAESVLNTAESNIYNQQRRVSEKEESIRQFEANLSKNKSEKNNIIMEIQTLTGSISMLRKQLSSQSDISLRLRKLTAFVSRAAARAEVLDDQVKFLYDPSIIIEPLKELAKHLSLPGSPSFAVTWDGSGISEFAIKLKMIACADASWNDIHVLEHHKDHTVLIATESGKSAFRRIRSINKVSNSISSNNEMLEQSKVMMSDHVSWEDFLVPVPMTIAFLGQLMLISTLKDFPIDKHKPKHGFRYLKHPKSFRASVVQTTKATWDVFNKAQKNMDQIRIYSTKLPAHLMSIIRMIEYASNEELQEYLHLSILSVKNISDKCLKKAKEAEEGIIRAMDLIGELQEASTGTKGHYQRQLDKAKCNIEILQEEKGLIRAERELLGKQFQQLSESIQTAEKHFLETMNDLPVGGSVLGMAVTDGIVTGFNAVLNVLSLPSIKRKQRQSNLPVDTPSNRTADMTLDQNQRKAYNEAILLQQIVANFSQRFDEDGKVRQNEIGPNISVYTYEARIRAIKDRVFRLKDCDVKTAVIEYCTKAMAICSELDTMMQEFSDNTRLSGSLLEEIETLKTNVNDLALKGQKLMEACPMKQAPNREAWQVTDNVGEGVVKTQMENAKFKAKVTCENLKHAQENSNRVSSNFTEKSERLAKVLGDAAKINLEKIDFEEILDILHRGLTELGNLRQSWGKIIHFFYTVSNITACSLDVSLDQFLTLSESTKKDAVKGYNLTHLKRDLIYMEVMRASQIAYYLSNLSESYDTVSKQFIMPPMESLPILLRFNPDTQKTAIQAKMDSLKTDCISAQTAIGLLIKKKQFEFETSIESRISNIQKRIKHLPALEDKTEESIIDELA